MKRILRLLVALVGIGYPAALLGVVALLWIVGERWWVTTVVLYLPRWGWALPLPFVIGLLLVARQRRLVACQVFSVYLLLFPLMGLELERGETRRGGDLRVFSQNIHMGSHGLDRVVSQIKWLRPNVVVLQEAFGPRVEPLRGHFPDWQYHAYDQFVLITPFPIKDVFVPPKIAHGRHQRTARFVRYTLETPHGLVDVFNVHPISPRDGFDELRGEGVSSELGSGRFFTGAARHIDPNTELRRRQVEEIARLAAASDRPVVIGGDTNLPTLSSILRRHFGRFQDGFSQAGFGFGYTFPAHHPWLRIDRILANDRLVFTGFEVGEVESSDHLGVLGILQLRR
jgi:endonuclease/exonuclease/phosphatase family metal-dependent hydrolase